MPANADRRFTVVFGLRSFLLPTHISTPDAVVGDKKVRTTRISHSMPLQGCARFKTTLLKIPSLLRPSLLRLTILRPSCLRRFGRQDQVKSGSHQSKTTWNLYGIIFAIAKDITPRGQGPAGTGSSPRRRERGRV